MNLLDLPTDALEYIFEQLSYDEVAKCRLICTQVDKMCQGLLNRGFQKVCRLHVQHMKNIRAQLPRRESERRNHRLARHADILQCIETRISMLMMTYNKFIEANMCCFIPGKVIDEVLRLLRLVGDTGEQFRAREILQELRDITSMAIEHFDEKIAPELKKMYQDNAKFQLKGTPFALIINAIRGGSAMSLGDESMLDASTSSNTSTTEEPALPRPSCSDSAHSFLITKMNARIMREVKSVQLRHMKMFRAQNAQIAELKAQMAELKRRVDETDAKNREIHLNVNQMSSHQPVSSAASPSVVGPDTSTPFLRTPNIRPRTANIRLKRRLEDLDVELEADATEEADQDGGGGARKIARGRVA